MTIKTRVTTSLLPSEGTSATVAWLISTTSSEAGLAEVDISQLQIEDCEVIAELRTLNHLLSTDRRLAGVPAGSIELHVSRGLIRKMWLGRKTADHRHLHGWISLLRTRYAASRMKVTKAKVELAPGCRLIELDGMAQTPAAIMSKAGRIVITRHALERFMSHNNIQSIDRAYSKLEEELSGDIAQVDVPDHIRQYKSQRHGADAEIWTSNRGLCFNLIDSGPHRTLVTVARPRQKQFTGMGGLLHE